MKTFSVFASFAALAFPVSALAESPYEGFPFSLSLEGVGAPVGVTVSEVGDTFDGRFQGRPEFQELLLDFHEAIAAEGRFVALFEIKAPGGEPF